MFLLILISFGQKVTGSLTIVKAKIETNIPKKRTGSSNHPKALTKFYDTIYRAVLQHVDFSTVKCVLCAGPGYVKDDFHQYMLDESVKRDDRSIIENKGKFVLCRASSGHKHALEEVFADPAVMSRVVETRLAKEIDVLNRFMRCVFNFQLSLLCFLVFILAVFTNSQQFFVSSCQQCT